MLKNVTFAKKIALAFLLLIGTMVATSGVTYMCLATDISASAMNTQGSDMLNALDNLFESALQAERAATQFAVEASPDHFKQFADASDGFKDKIASVRKRAQGYRKEADLLPILDKIEHSYGDWADQIGRPVFQMGTGAASIARMIDLIKSEEADKLREGWSEAFSAAKERLDRWSGEDQVVQDDSALAARNAQIVGVVAAT